MKPEIQFNAEKHIYTVNGFVIPSVTQIISSAGFGDFSKVPEGILDRAREFGIAVHSAIEYDDNGTLDIESLDSKLLPYVEQWRKLKKDKNIEVIKSEIICYSSLWGYCGTLDKLIKIEGKVGILDLKTSSELRKETALQLAGYVSAYNEHFNKKVSMADRYVVRLTGEGNPEFKQYKDWTDVIVWESCLRIHNFKRGK